MTGRPNLDRLDQATHDLHRRTPGMARQTTLPQAFAQTGRWLLQTDHDPPSTRPLATLQLPNIASPKTAFICHAGNGHQEAAARTLRRLGPMLRHYRACVVMTDDASGAASAALARIPGLHYRPTSGSNPTERANEAARSLGAERLVFLHPQIASSQALALLLDQTRSAPLVIGNAAAQTARLLGLASLLRPAGTTATADAGIALIASRSAFLALGGLDPAMEDGAGLSALDFALRGYAAGLPIFALEGAAYPIITPGPDPKAARRHFATRWA